MLVHVIVRGKGYIHVSSLLGEEGSQAIKEDAWMVRKWKILKARYIYAS